MAKTDADRAQKYREGVKANLAKHSGRWLRVQLYGGTNTELAKIVALGEFPKEQEAITIMVQNVSRLADSNPELFNKLITPGGVKQ